MSSVIPAHAAQQCSIRGSTTFCAGGSGTGSPSGQNGKGGHSTVNNNGDFTISGGGSKSGGGGSGGHQTFKNGQYNCKGKICP
jgi:hypothetical protein